MKLLNARPALACCLLALSACSHDTAPPAQAGSAPLQPIATLQELMAGTVDPAADGLWDSVATTITASGVDEHQPRTPKEWAAVRQDALHLVEATNLLLIHGRHVARTPFPAGEDGSLGSAQIEAGINAKRAAFDGFAVALRATGLQALAAIDAHDAQKLLDVGGSLDAVCEACHVQFWYPGQGTPSPRAKVSDPAGR